MLQIRNVLISGLYQLKISNRGTCYAEFAYLYNSVTTPEAKGASTDDLLRHAYFRIDLDGRRQLLDRRRRSKGPNFRLKPVIKHFFYYDPSILPAVLPIPFSRIPDPKWDPIR